MSKHRFTPGQVYHRRNDIHAIFKGQQYGGIATPAAAPYVFLFTGDAGEEFGYADEFQPDGLYWYTGEGQLGDMQMAKGNAAICRHQSTNKSLLLFEAAQTGHARFVGEMAYVGHHTEKRPDREQKLRQAIVFHLELLPPRETEAAQDLVAQENSPNYSARTTKLNELRQKALRSSPVALTTSERLINIRTRSAAIKAYALSRATGVCEGCLAPAPFETKRGPFLEVHHVDRLADGGPDHPNGVIALCPNCHRKAHYAKNASAFNGELKARLEIIESQ